MKLSELFTTNYELFVRLNAPKCKISPEVALEEIERKRAQTGHNFFACFDSLTGFACLDARAIYKAMYAKKFACMLGEKLKRGSIMWFSRGQYVAVDWDNWKEIYGLIVPTQKRAYDGEMPYISRKILAEYREKCARERFLAGAYEDTRYRKNHTHVRPNFAREQDKLNHQFEIYGHGTGKIERYEIRGNRTEFVRFMN